MNYLLPLPRRAADALLGERRRRGRRRAVLRSLGHRQDDALERSRARAHWRRRARVGRSRACSTSKADATPRRSVCPLKPSPRSMPRRNGSGPCSRTWPSIAESRRLDLDDDRLTENTRAAYPISFIGNAVPSGQGGHPAEHRDADRRRVRRVAADLAADGRRSDVPLPVRLHGEGRRARKKASPSRRRRSARASARRSCRWRRAATPRCSASGSRSIRRGCGW